MKILILEDNPERVKVFKQCLSVKHEVVYVESVVDAISWAENEEFDVMFIDHDLGGEVYVDSEEANTGYQFAKWLFEKNIKAQFVTHSLNPVGAMNICKTLPKCTHMPFTALKLLLEKGLIL